MPKYISMQELDTKARELGTVGAALQWAKANGYEVDQSGGTVSLPPSGGELAALPGQQPLYDQPPTNTLAAKPMAAEPAAELAAKPAEAGPLSEMALLRKDIDALPNQMKAAYDKIFAQGQDYIAKAYAGPSTSQQLFALSKALLQPKPYRGFAGSLANITGALDQSAQARDEAMRKRALAEQNLRQTLDTAAAGDPLKSLQLRYQLIKEENDARKDAAAEAKAKAPTYQLNPLTGKPTEVPKFAHRPVTKTDYDAIPYGEYYVVPSGPNAGQIVQKLAK